MTRIASLFLSLLLLIIGTCTPGAHSTVQCNMGLKVFSVESGNSICAPLTQFNCVEACEWNMACTQSSHYTAFRGRRTYIAGVVLTNATFMLQCCASLGTVTQLDTSQEPICRWTAPFYTVEDMGSIRFDPPLAANEYIRDMTIQQREGNGRVSVRTQICKYTVQWNSCDRKTMGQEEAHFYSLLLLRLNRTKDYLRKAANWSASVKEEKKPIVTPVNTTATDDDFARDEPPPMNNFHSLAKHSTPPTIELQYPVTATTVAGESSVALTPAPAPIHQLLAPVKNQNTSNSSSSSSSLTNESPILHRRIHKDPSLFSSIGGGRRLTTDGVIDTRSRLNRLPIGLIRAMPTIHQRSPTIPAKATYKVMVPARDAVIGSGDGDGMAVALTNNDGQHRPHKRNRQWPIATNYSRELLGAVPHLTLGVEAAPAVEQQVADEVEDPNDNDTQQQPHDRKVHDGYVSSPSFEWEHLLEHTSYGGSFAATNEFNHQPNGLTFGRLVNGVLPKISPPPPPPPLVAHSLSKAPEFKIIPVSYSPRSHSNAHAQNNNRPSSFIPRSLRPIEPVLQFEHQSSAAVDVGVFSGGNAISKRDLALSGLLECCQQQAPGCKHLCSRDVNKEEIKHAIVTHQCPPLSMTSVLQCFPRFYNTSSVSRCCAKPSSSSATQPTVNSSASLQSLFTISGAGAGASSAGLPPQCHSLCAPEFKVNFSHLACVDHISTIVECYRELLL